VNLLARVTGRDMQRLPFTSDLLPTEVLMARLAEWLQAAYEGGAESAGVVRGVATWHRDRRH
jgi:hypothetical protein